MKLLALVLLIGTALGFTSISITEKGRAFFRDLWVKLLNLFSKKINIDKAEYGCLQGDVEEFRATGYIKPLGGYITWYLDTNHLSKRSISREDTLKGIKKAFAIIEPYMGKVRFKEVMSKAEAQIVIGFYTNGEQGLPRYFSSRTLAYAYLANNSESRGLISDMFFNDRYLWALTHGGIPGGGGVNFTKIFLHELLHALGLHHQTIDRNGILYPSYFPNNTIRLIQDTIDGLNHLYGNLEGPVDGSGVEDEHPSNEELLELKRKIVLLEREISSKDSEISSLKGILKTIRDLLK